MSPKNERDDFPNEYVVQRLLEVQKKYKLTAIKMAEIAGYERSTHRRVLLGKNPCNVVSLYRLSKEFGLTMDFWFPRADGAKPQSLPPPKCIYAGLCTQTKKLVEMISKLSAEQKDSLSKHLQQEGWSDPSKEEVALLKIFRAVSPKKQSLILRVLDQFQSGTNS